jgi:hypothetical protein
MDPSRSRIRETSGLGGRGLRSRSDNSGRYALLCPSAQPEMRNSVVIGVMTEEKAGTRLAYLEVPQPVTEDLLALAAPVRPTQVFRFAAVCETSACVHFDGEHCRLASRVVQMLPVVVDTLPPCQIRRSCRWFAEQRSAACRRCPQIATYSPAATESETRVANPT